MHWDATIRLGDLLTAAVFIGTIVSVYIRLRERLATIETQLAPLWTAYVSDHGARPIERRRTKRRESDRT